MAKADQEKESTRTFVREDGTPALSLTDFQLVIVDGPAGGNELALNKERILIGSGQENDLIIEDTTVSRKHCELERIADRFILRDLDSTNGTFLDGTSVREGFVKPGSVIEVGKTQIRVQSITEEIDIKPSKRDQFGELKGKSVKMRELFSILERVAPTETTILIQGETGTGKELVARAIHDHSNRASGPLVVFDCSAVAPTLIESELFGHTRGSFTGAINDRRGAFEAAHRGTLFLDEIGELTEELQPKLLRALEHKEVRRVGGDKAIRVDVRLVAATNRNLQEEVDEGKFREDLFFRLSVIPLILPSLRQRREDIPLLVEAFLEQAKERLAGKKIKGMSKKALNLLLDHSWPGNVRELKNAVEGAMAMTEGQKIEPKDFIFFSRPKESSSPAKLDGLIGKSLEQVEKAIIEGTLKSHRGNKMATAKVLGIAYSTLYEKIKKYGIEG